MPGTIFDTEAFHSALDSQRIAMGMTWKDVAGESKVSASTLTRMAQGKKPDADGLAALLHWSGLNAETFIRAANAQPKGKTESLAQISALLRADNSLNKQSAAAIEEIVRAAYNRFKEPHKK
jgi:transcriptional regulator with XRE-family HTH domain